MDDTFADANLRREQLYDELAASPAKELVGIVGSRSVSASRFRDQELWSLLLTLTAWRVGSEPIRTEPLTLRRRVNDNELQRFQNLIEAETVIRIQARLAENNVFGTPQGQLEKFIQVDSTDSELHARLAELQKPVTYQDERFGTLTFDRRASWYAAEVKWQDETIALNVNVEKPDELNSALEVAYALWNHESTWHKRVVDYAIEHLLPLKNDTWLDDDGTGIFPEQFRDRMTLQSISVYPKGNFDFWHDDGDLFWGHSIQVSGDLFNGLTRADIPG